MKITACKLQAVTSLFSSDFQRLALFTQSDFSFVSFLNHPQLWHGAFSSATDSQPFIISEPSKATKENIIFSCLAYTVLILLYNII